MVENLTIAGEKFKNVWKAFKYNPVCTDYLYERIIEK